jgi:type IV secretory pathway VirB10-like protein
VDDPQSQGTTPSHSKLPWREHPEKATHIAVVILGVLTLAAGLWLLALNLDDGPSNGGPQAIVQAAPVPTAPAPVPTAPAAAPVPTAPAAAPAPVAPAPATTDAPVAPAPATPAAHVANDSPEPPATHEVHNTRGDQNAPWLMLRAEPNAKAAERYAMQDGTQLRVLETNLGAKGTWWHVRVIGGEADGTTGYAHSRWIRTIADR